ncbi:MAG: sigma 54-interacting transcriptional regulator [Bdellovibrionales bacterium]
MTEKLATPTQEHKSGYLYCLSHAQSQPLEIGEFLSLGREPGNLITLADPYVSGRHLRIEKREGQFLLKDLRSRNGTYLNGSRIAEAILTPGDRIQIGEREYIFQDKLQTIENHPLLKSKSPPWQNQLLQLPSFARTHLPVLLLGPSGTGKEILARLIHEQSPRNRKPFVSVNCSALSESLVESELFGHTKGSFTGATHNRSGAFEAARGGTLFLDEIGDLPMSLQPKLLRALENKEIRPVGSDKTISTDVRIIAATHQNLHEKIKLGQFRSDLFFRLHVIKLAIPSLKQRMEDFEDLLYAFAREMRVAFAFSTIETLKSHSWPGNIRELKNMVARASALFPGVRIQEEHLTQLIDAVTPYMEHQPQLDSRMPIIKELEKEMIKQRLIANNGNQRQTAADLNMPKSTLHDRIKSYGIHIEELVKIGV